MPNDAELRSKVYDMLCPFIMKWCGDYGPHLIDTDGNDGEMLRQDLEDLIHAEVEAELKGFAEALRKPYEYRTPEGELVTVVGFEDPHIAHINKTLADNVNAFLSKEPTDEYELAFCPDCNQVTNHIGPVCQKCLVNEY
jgi:hypothetical protein